MIQSFDVGMWAVSQRITMIRYPDHLLFLFFWQPGDPKCNLRGSEMNFGFCGRQVNIDLMLFYSIKTVTLYTTHTISFLLSSPMGYPISCHFFCVRVTCIQFLVVCLATPMTKCVPVSNLAKDLQQNFRRNSITINFKWISSHCRLPPPTIHFWIRSLQIALKVLNSNSASIDLITATVHVVYRLLTGFEAFLACAPSSRWFSVA